MKKIINWENWNVIEDELVRKSLKINDNNYYDGEPELDLEVDQGELRLPTIITPFGEYRSDSIFRPALRWKCWIAHTNFHVTHTNVEILNYDIPGIEALSILGAYTFCIGVAKMFDWTDVRQYIEEELCIET